MKDKIKALVKRGLDAVTREVMKSLARGAARDVAEQAQSQQTVIEPDAKLKLEGGYEAMMYSVPQAHMPPMIIALKQQSYTECGGIANKDIDYVVGSENYWLTVDQDTKQYHVSARSWPPLWTCSALPDPDVPRG